MLVGDLQGRMAVANALSDKMQGAAELNQKIFGLAGDPASSDLMQIAKKFAGELAESTVVAGRITDKLYDFVKGARELEKEDFEKSDTVTAAERIMEHMEEDDDEGALKKTVLGKVIKLAHPGEEELGSAAQYYPVMYFVDKKYTETMTTCKGPLVDKPVVGESIDGCASACDAEVHNCVGFMYYGTGDSSLCFLYSGFKSAMYWTGCDAPAEKKEFLQIQEKSSSDIAIKPWGCGRVSSAWQSQTDDAGETSIQRLDIETGDYDLVFKIPTKNTDPPFRNINSCAINPQNEILYCSIQINDKGCFLVAIDQTTTIGFVHKLPGWQYSGVFDKDGNYYCNGENSWSVVPKVQDMSIVSSWSELTAPEPEKKSAPSGNIGADAVTFVEDLQGTGSPQTYVMAVEGQTVTLIEVSNKKYPITTLKAESLPAGKVWAAAWTFKSTLFIAAEDGSGSYQVDMSSFNLEEKTCAFKASGKSAKLEWNDGFSCQNAISALVPTMPPNPEPYTTPTTTTAAPTRQRDDPQPDPQPLATTPAPPNIGQVKCMAKLSKFEGTTLKPDPSGKCKQCMKKLVNAQRCYE